MRIGVLLMTENKPINLVQQGYLINHTEGTHIFNIILVFFCTGEPQASINVVGMSQNPIILYDSHMLCDSTSDTLLEVLFHKLRRRQQM